MQPTDPSDRPGIVRTSTQTTASTIRATCIARDQHPISRQFISVNALKVMRHLNKSGFQAYLVGGAVRDMLLNKLPKDFDIATDATPEEIRRLFRNARIIGRRFRIVHVLFGSEVIEVTTFRGHHNADENDALGKNMSMTNEQGMLLRDNVYGSMEEDALRRDFTINALYYSLENFSVYDFTNGIEDIKAKRLRLIGDPLLRFKEDPVRMLRALRFAAKLGFTIEPATLAEIESHADLLNLIPPARLFDEFSKLFITGHAVETYQQLRQHNMLKYLLYSDDLINGNPLYEALVQQAFINTDLRLKNGKSVTPAFIFSVLLWPAYCRARALLDQEKMPVFAAIHAATDQVMQQQSRHTALPKHIQGSIKEIWELQERLTSRHGKRAFKLLEHPKFRAGYDFLLLREQVQETPAGLGEWWTQFQIQDEGEREESVQSLGAGAPSRNPEAPQAQTPAQLMNLAYIALGSNLENPLQQVTAAITAIGKLGNIVRASSWYRSSAVGPAELPEYSQPDYINGVLALATELSPEDLLDALQSIEQAQGRIRTIRWGARTLDLDILLFNHATLQTPRLNIPHPHMTQRNFVMVPLHEIAPDLTLPDGRTIAGILAALNTEGLEKLGQNS